MDEVLWLNSWKKMRFVYYYLALSFILSILIVDPQF